METETLCSDEDAQELVKESQLSIQLSTIEVGHSAVNEGLWFIQCIEPTEYIDDIFKLKESKTGNTHLKGILKTL